jgi:cytochrome c-type biogenesis protein CcmH
MSPNATTPNATTRANALGADARANAAPVATSATATSAAPARWKALLRDRSVLAGLLVLLAVAAVWGDVMLRGAGPETLDQRVHDVASQLEYPGATNISVADAPTIQAAQMRAFIRDRLQHGWSEDQVIQYFVDHYGESIREVPPFGGLDLLMWLAPVALLLAGVLMVTGVGRQWRAAAAAPTGSPVADYGSTADAEDALTDADLEAYRPMLDADPDVADYTAPRTAGSEAK